MALVYIGRVASAAVLAVGIGVVVEAGQAPASGSQSSATAGQKVTVTGCVQRESDYRKMNDAGRGGVAGSGVGVGNEFVLTNATVSTGASSSSAPSAPNSSSSAGSPSSSSSSSSSSSPSSSSSASGAQSASAAGPGVAYELTGSGEGQAAQHVGKRVEITGVFKAAETTASGAPTGGPTAGRPPSGVDVTSKDMKLRELEVTSVREVGSTCPA